MSASLAILISGAGSNLKALFKAIEQGCLSATIAVVVSDSPMAGGVEFAKQNGLPTCIIEPSHYASRLAFDEALVAKIQSFAVDWVVLAGFMRKLTPYAVDCYRGKMINIHPSLLPKFPGLNTHQRVLQSSDQTHGCTVHFVTEDLDAGPVIAQSSLAIEPNDTASSLKKRVQQLEYQLYWRALQHCLSENVVFADGGAHWREANMSADIGVIPKAE